MGVFDLPEGYAEFRRVNLQKDKKLAVCINAAALIIAALLVPLGLFMAPISFGAIFESFIYSPVGLLLRSLMLICGLLIYLIAHELVHGIFIKKYSGRRAKYGFTGLYAYAGSAAYFNKRCYLIIALAPVVLLGALFLVLNVFLPIEWFWLVYLLQVINLSGAAGDLYVTAIMRKFPDDTLTQDTGFEMTFYSHETL